MELGWPRDERMAPCAGWQKRTIISDPMSCTLSLGGARGLRYRHGLSHQRLARIQVLAVSDLCDLDETKNAESVRVVVVCYLLTMTREMPFSKGEPRKLRERIAGRTYDSSLPMAGPSDETWSTSQSQ